MSIASIKSRLEKATKGPWKEGNHNWGIWAPISNLILMIDTKNPDHRGNSNFITHARADIPILLKVVEAASTIDHIDQLIEFMDYADRMMEQLGNPDNADINVGALAEKVGAVGYKASDEHQVQDDLLTFRAALVELEESE